MTAPSDERGEPARFAMRDASSYNRPSQDRPIVYHAIVAPQFWSACAGVFLTAQTEVSAKSVTPGMVCRRKACWNRYLAATTRVGRGAA